MAERLSTGVDPLDDALGGGLPPGSSVALQAPPESQSRSLLRAGRGLRPTVYLTTILAERAVRKMFEETGDSSNYTVSRVGVTDPLSEAREVLARLDGRANVIVDAMNPLESGVDEADYVDFLTELDAVLDQTGSVGFLHCLEADPPPKHREFTLSAVEFLWSLDVETRSEQIEFFLEIPKSRAIAPETRVLNFELGEDVRVDTSRDIGCRG